MSADAICIAAPNLMPALRERLASEGDVLTFSDTEPITALQAILDHRPALIVLERLFAATPRGAALVNRIKSDPQLAHAEVRIMSHTGDYVRQVVKPTAPRPVAPAATGGDGHGLPSVATLEEQARHPDWRGTRRATRHRVRDGVEIQLDGNAVAVVDVCIVGAQVLSPIVLRPNQKVRVTFAVEDSVTRFRGAIAWAKFELAGTPRYRAGVEFLDADAAVVDEFCARNRI